MRAYDGGGSSNFIYQDGLGADSVKRTSQEVSHQKNKKRSRMNAFSCHLHLENFARMRKK